MLLFRSRSSRFIRAAAAFLWPRKGFARGWTFIAIRVLRLRSSDYSLAAGLAAGVFAATTPLIGAHFFLAAGLAWLIRGNIITALVGTLAGNPWTYPLIWSGTYAAGSRILGEERVVEDLERLDFALLMEYPGTVLVSMSVGSLAVGLPASALVLAAGYAFADPIRGHLMALRGGGGRRRKRIER